MFAGEMAKEWISLGTLAQTGAHGAVGVGERGAGCEDGQRGEDERVRFAS